MREAKGREIVIVCANCWQEHDNRVPTFTLKSLEKGENPIHLCDKCNIEKCPDKQCDCKRCGKNKCAEKCICTVKEKKICEFIREGIELRMTENWKN